jgi:hypothetical protein
VRELSQCQALGIERALHLYSTREDHHAHYSHSCCSHTSGPRAE